MPSDLLARVDLDLLYLPYLEKVLETLAACKARGARYIATYGTRTFAEQAKIYFQGRTTPGPVVTNARPGFSMHNYGIGMDFVRDADAATAKLEPAWSPADYDVLREEGEVRGLQVGLAKASGKRYDFGHVQLPLARLRNKLEIEVLTELKAIHARGGLSEVWKTLDSWKVVA